MTKATYRKVGGVWKQIHTIWRKVSGVWQSGIISWINVEGVWKDCIVLVPAKATITGVSQPVMGGALRAIWNSVTDADAYKLYRKPWWTGAAWSNTWNLIYAGANLTFDDPVYDENPDDGAVFDYKLIAYNIAGDGPESDVVNGTWWMA